MQGEITSELSFCLSENGFSLDELVKKVSDLFERKAMVELIRLILLLVHEVLMHRLFKGRSSMQCCQGGTLQLNGSYRRRIRCSVGEIVLDFWRVRCSICGKTFVPLKRFCRL